MNECGPKQRNVVKCDGRETSQGVANRRIRRRKRRRRKRRDGNANRIIDQQQISIENRFEPIENLERNVVNNSFNRSKNVSVVNCLVITENAWYH